MDLLKTLKKLKNIKADEGFTRKSRDLILATSRSAPLNTLNIWRIILNNFETGAALALAGLLIFMIMGGFSAWKFFSPLQISGLDQASLRAEAQAIDIQIQLTDLTYNEPLSLKLSESTQPTQGEIGTAPKSNVENKKSETGGAASPATSTSELSIDEALDKLGE